MKIKDVYYRLSLNKLYNLIAKSPKKTIQIIVFVLLIFAFTFNHYSFIKPCVKWEKESRIKLDIIAFNARASGNANYIKGPDVYEEVNVCKKYSLFPTVIKLDYRQTAKIPADLIFLFIGIGIIFFTKDIKSK